jgi:hypothetical protein
MRGAGIKIPSRRQPQIAIMMNRYNCNVLQVTFLSLNLNFPPFASHGCGGTFVPMGIRRVRHAPL